MKQPGFFIFVCCLLWAFTKSKAAAQENPYHCNTLKVTCFDNAKINIRYFDAPKACLPACNFCGAIAKEDWLAVNKQLKTEVKSLRGTPETLNNLRNRLLAHRLVNFVLLPEPIAQNR